MDISTIKTLNQEQLFLQDTLLDIAGAGSEFEQQILFNALLERAKELKCYMQLKMAIRAFKEDLRAQMRGVGVNNITDFGYPYG
ncbi:MAG: hypothetical protein IJP92_02665, partial [Lachnospiraceae bacterium]|nr:hypothetical protein [Lachnospiraceae bacterium]